jgi:cystathionine beta-lyase
MAFDFDAIIDRSETWSMKWDYGARVLGEPGILPMWVADMDFKAPPAVVKALTRRAEHGIYGYPMTPATFWAALISWLEQRQGWPVHKEWLVLAPGVVPSLSFCVRAFTRLGDKVVVQTPVYFPFFSAVEKNGRTLVRNPLRLEASRFRMDFDDLARKVDSRTRMIILCSPHNPVGRVWTREELSRVGEIAAARDLVVVSDEIHGDLVLGGCRHIPFASLSEDLARRTITLLAPSKTFNVAGLTTSLAIIADEGRREAFEAQLESAGFEIGNLFGLAALEAAYAQGGAWLDKLLAYLDGNADIIAPFLAERAPAVEFLRPEGTYLGLLNGRKLGFAPRALHELFWKKGRVLFSEGSIFGEELNGFERINFGCPRAVLREALERIARAVATF